ncbi:dihydropteroate synthase [Roseococcus sp. SDR]|uniref:dihydropteroate synthase n=1 Tax=Roseococcus sp. SDR TaxID=2835532 RepID=UPI001BCBAC9F|nr:dihydropteroate synthase [Roseococcus sp. SDR]MBS7792431.1 dihydropteroate synthase [Roseococcus sp. SDR]MBV1847745.1 dihydropteroate synthase [Roseococcus sp. SDR]
MSTEWLEPLGLLQGPAAFAALRDGLALPLQGGPFAFTLVREPAGTVLVPPDDHPALERLTRPLPPFAGIERHRARPLVMGIVNCTPDSFSGDGLGAAHDAAIAQGHAMLEAGADILDVGGESTRPDAAPVTPEEEQARILPVIRALAKAAPVSVDTRHARSMAAALEAGAEIVNDVSALRHDPEAVRVIAQARCPVILMHMRTLDPRTMQKEVRYEDAALEVARFLEGRVATLEALGIPRGRICVDPGLGFGKRVEDNLALIARLPLFANLGCTILVGASRKSFIGRITGVAEAGQRMPGSLGIALAAAAQGAHILRVHDVAETVQALQCAEAVAVGFEEG